MWHRTKVAAVLSALRIIDRKVDPEEIIDRAARFGIGLPIAVERVSAPSLTGQLGWAFTVNDVAAFRVAVDQILASPRSVDQADKPEHRPSPPAGRRTQATASASRIPNAGKAA